ncbi:MAG: Bug family tripartite tricarboxylate transporter substrate binding protein [Alphaproteobacteria bacterium]|jgi:tripartite-type tricarboxylate transporter receptor subunit TctC|nr:tripartite tricarboxylate transporter substrate binding protein [Roseomonas sp.]
MNRRDTLKGALALSGMTALPAMAQNLDRPVRFVVPFAPGGTSDIIARLLSPELTKSFGQNVVVENRTGASGNIGADLVAKSPPDGHTMLIIDVSTLATAPSLYTRFPFDLKRDLAPVTMLIYAPYILAVHPSVPVNNAAELVAYAKANPTKVNVGHAGIGVGNHLTGLLVTQHWGADLTQVPYRGGAAALTAVASGEAQMLINGATATAPFCKQGQLRAIAVTGPRRLPDFPDLPTFQELGWPAAESGTWQGVLVQGGTPPAMVERLSRDLRAAMAVPSVAERITAIGGENRAEGPESFRRWLDNEIEVWGRVVRANNIKLD